MKITADDIRSWACNGACAYIATTYPDGVEVDEAFLRRWAAGEEWMETHWTDLARVVVQVNPSVVFVIANMALEYAARLNPSLIPYVGTVVDEATAAVAEAAAEVAARAGAEAAVWAARAAAGSAAWAAVGVEEAKWAAVRAAAVAARAAWAAWAAEGKEAKGRIIALCIATILKGKENV